MDIETNCPAKGKYTTGAGQLSYQPELTNARTISTGNDTTRVLACIQSRLYPIRGWWYRDHYRGKYILYFNVNKNYQLIW